MDPSHFNRIKNGHVVPSLKTALRICEILGLEVEDVFSLRTAKSRPAREGSPQPAPRQNAAPSWRRQKRSSGSHGGRHEAG
jgi:DNA-binding XRE family transcriptional regulator